MILSDITNSLKPISDTPALDASVLIANVINKPRAWVMAHPELTLTLQQQEKMKEALTRLDHGESFPYVLGHWEFFGLDLDLTSNVLIPRPETELLVENAIAWLHKYPARRRIADIGTGSGAIALAIAVNVPNARILGTDLSAQALEVASRNARKYGVADRINFVQCDLLPQAGNSFAPQHSLDLICANLPYIPTETLHQLPVFQREPILALDGGPDGLKIIRRLITMAPEWLAYRGRMLLEIEATRGIQALNFAYDIFSEAKIHLHRDLAGRDRLLEITI